MQPLPPVLLRNPKGVMGSEPAALPFGPRSEEDAATLRYYPLAPVLLRNPKGVMGVMGSERGP